MLMRAKSGFSSVRGLMFVDRGLRFVAGKGFRAFERLFRLDGIGLTRDDSRHELATIAIFKSFVGGKSLLHLAKRAELAKISCEGVGKVGGFRKFQVGKFYDVAGTYQSSRGDKVIPSAHSSLY